jgi:hypothetical protein
MIRSVPASAFLELADATPKLGPRWGRRAGATSRREHDLERLGEDAEAVIEAAPG